MGGMSVTTVLTISTVIQGLKNQLPSVSYLTALDVYLWACFFFLSSTLVEYAYLNYVTVILPHYKVKSDDEKLETFVRQADQRSRKMSMTEGLRYRNFNKNRINGSMRDNSISSLCYYDMDSYGGAGENRVFSAKTYNNDILFEESPGGLKSLDSIDSGLDKERSHDSFNKKVKNSNNDKRNDDENYFRYQDHHSDDSLESSRYRDEISENTRVSTSSKQHLILSDAKESLVVAKGRQSRKEWNEQMKHYRRELDIDRKFRIFYTAFFVLFNACYWFYYLQLSKHE